MFTKLFAMAVLKFSKEQLLELIAKMDETDHSFVALSTCHKYHQGDEIPGSAYLQCFGSNTEIGSGGLYIHAVTPKLVQDSVEEFYKQVPRFEFM